MHKFRSPTLSFVFSLFLSLFLLPTLAFAQQLPTPPALAAKSWLLIEAGSGQELAAQAADERLEPASLTKLMTAYLTFAAIKQGTIKPEQNDRCLGEGVESAGFAHVHPGQHAGEDR
jgi:D-alanyl-D-alanine carboxypeptidase